MKITCCMLEMVTLIFLLFVSMNGGFSYLEGARESSVPSSTAELVSSWGEPDRIAAAADLGFASSQLDAVEVWSYDELQRAVIVRNDAVISIREG